MPGLAGRARPAMEIRPLAREDRSLLDALATASVRAAALSSPAWLPTEAAARAELAEALGPGRTALAALDGGVPAGWGAAFPSHESAWEIHPLLVDPARHGRGAGRALVAALEAVAARAGALAIELSTSDATGATTLAGRDLWADPLGALAGLQVRAPGGRHAVAFWRALGYAVVGVLPDAEGRGVPSIRFAKRIAPRPIGGGEPG